MDSEFQKLPLKQNGTQTIFYDSLDQELNHVGNKTIQYRPKGTTLALTTNFNPNRPKGEKMAFKDFMYQNKVKKNLG